MVNFPCIGKRSVGYNSVTCESLVSREFSRIFFLFHFSISISRHFHFTFHSRSRFQGIFISLFTLEMSERKNKFTFHFSKRVKAFQISLFFSRKKSELCMSCHKKFEFFMTRNAYFTLFSREKRVKSEMLSLFPRNEK